MWRFRAEDELRVRLTRKDFLKAAGTGTAGLALLGASAATSGCSYLPEGGSKVNVVVVIVDSLRRITLVLTAMTGSRPRTSTRWPRRVFYSLAPTPSRSPPSRQGGPS